MRGRPKLVVLVAVCWFVAGLVLVAYNVPSLVQSLDPSGPGLLPGMIRTAPDYISALVSLAAVLIALAGLWGAYGLLVSRISARLTLELATWALLFWLFAAAAADPWSRASQVVQAFALVFAAACAVPVLLLLFLLKSRWMRESSGPA
ncbi:MAG: hypothetical protein Q8S43_09610 [Actinomycetota bacterium]|nr:hypothetical protein [Actinomycetota bacterium]MDP3631188.1 hypothetical protein [Actinomycetota bacterium]